MPTLTEPIVKQSSVLTHVFFGIEPINNLEEGIKSGGFNGRDPDVTDRNVPLQSMAGARDLLLVCFNRVFAREDHGLIFRLIHSMKKEPAPPNWLFGLMRAVPEVRMPINFYNKNIISAKPKDPAFACRDRHGNPCFVFASRHGQIRELRLTYTIDRRSEFWSFLLFND